MKFRNLLLATVACAGLFTACSNGIDEAIDNGGNGTNNQGVAYASFAYALPAGSSSTRALSTEVGTDEENKVIEIAFVLFAKDGKFISVETVAREKFTPAEGSSTIYQTKSPIKVAAGEQQVYVIVNPSNAIKGYSGSEADFKQLTEESYQQGEGFTMSNAEVVEKYSINAKPENTVSNPVKITIPVERMAARIDYTATQADNKYKVVSAPDDNVTVTNYRIVNTRKNAFLLKRVGTTADNVTIGAGEDKTTSYVIDPFFAAKSDANFFTEANYALAYNNKLADEAIYTGLPTEKSASRLAYCHENTMATDAQKTGAATGLVFQAKYEPKLDGLNAAGDFYRYNGKLYSSLEAMYASLNPEWAAEKENKNLIRVDVLGFKKSDETNFNDFAGKFNFTTLKAKFVDLYAGGICYYSTYLKHEDNGNNQAMGIMEYAIVRNNIYKLSINTINKLGDPVAPIDPDKPVEEKDSYLDVTVNVMDWTVRSNSVDL